MQDGDDGRQRLPDVQEIEIDRAWLGDGAVEGGSSLLAALSTQLRKLQNGYVRSYALSLLVGVLIVAAALLAVNS